MILTEQEVFKCLPPEEDTIAFARAIESAVLEKLKAQERDRNLLNYSCQMCLDTGVLPKAAILPEPPDVKCPNGCRPKKQLPPADVVRDAERYKWLRKVAPNMFWDNHDKEIGFVRFDTKACLWKPEMFDAAIDAAMKEK